MKTVLIHGQNHHGTTCHIGRQLAEAVGGEVTEFFLPRDFGEFCIGCSRCFLESAEKCPHYAVELPILNALDAADLIILTSPVYVYHASAPMKNLLDHLGHRWMIHRPNEEMFFKQAVCVTTACGMGVKSALRDMRDNLFFWGVGKIYTYGRVVYSLTWKGVKEERKAKIGADMERLAAKIVAKHGRVRPGLKTRGMFEVARMLQKKIGLCEQDRNYWIEKGWIDGKRPWNRR